jgi:hypothetical protein
MTPILLGPFLTSRPVECKRLRQQTNVDAIIELVVRLFAIRCAVHEGPLWCRFLGRLAGGLSDAERCLASEKRSSGKSRGWFGRISCVYGDLSLATALYLTFQDMFAGLVCSDLPRVLQLCRRYAQLAKGSGNFCASVFWICTRLLGCAPCSLRLRDHLAMYRARLSCGGRPRGWWRSGLM